VAGGPGLGQKPRGVVAAARMDRKNRALLDAPMGGIQIRNWGSRFTSVPHHSVQGL